MNFKFICILLASFLSCLGRTSGLPNAVSVTDYEVKFNEAFQQYWFSNRTITPELKSLVQILLQPNLSIEEYPNIFKPVKCLQCRAIMYSLLNYYHKEFELNLNKYLIDLCMIVVTFPYQVCRGLATIYGPTVKFILKNRINELSSEEICSINQRECGGHPYPINFKIDIDPVPSLNTPKIYNFDERNFYPSDFITIAQITDVHYDPYYAPGSPSDCTEFICCRNTSTPKPNSAQKAGYWGSYRSCSSPGHLVENVCSHVALNHKNIDYVYFTGDFADHFAWQSSRVTVRETAEFVTRQLKENFPNVPKIMMIGNHDIHPSDAYAPEIVGPAFNAKWLYEMLADLWSDLLPQSALSTFRIGGYYTVTLPNRPGLRLIVLNNNLCWTYNIWLFYGNYDDMIIQLEWLRDTLLFAERNHEKVHILAHVPPNTATCVKAWNREYTRLVQRFAHIITGQFSGHTHKDSFSMFYSAKSAGPQVPVNVGWVGGSVSSNIGINPNYRIYTVEPNTFEVIDFDTYIYNLTAANLTPNRPPIWFKEYSFREAFGVTDLSPYTLSKLANETFRHNPVALRKMWNFYDKTSDVNLAKKCDDDCLEDLRQMLNCEHEDNSL